MNGENNSAVSTKWEGETTGEALDAFRAILAEMRKRSQKAYDGQFNNHVDCVRDQIEIDEIDNWIDQIESAAERVKVAHWCERERLRLLVERLVQRIMNARLASPNPGGEDSLLREAQYEIKGTPYAVIDGKPVVVLHGRVVRLTDGRTYVVNRPNCGMEADNG